MKERDGINNKFFSLYENVAKSVHLLVRTLYDVDSLKGTLCLCFIIFLTLVSSLVCKVQWSEGW